MEFRQPEFWHLNFDNVKIPLEVHQRCRIFTISQNPTELRQQFLLLDFSLSIFRTNFHSTYSSSLFYCPISVADFRQYISLSVVFLQTKKKNEEYK